MSRPTVNILTVQGAKTSTVELPKVYDTPIRAELVHHIYTNLAKNAMQPHGTDPLAGVKVSAVSWGPGRAKARVPRINGSGSNRNGQGAYANFCRGGHRFAPPTIQRRWFRPVPIKQRRYAIASAIAATAVAPLVQARGHLIEKVNEIPIVVEAAIEEIKRTRDAVALLKAVGVYQDVQRVMDNKVHRASKGKYRRSAFKTKKGPLVIFNEDKGIAKAFRNIPGVDTISVQNLSLAKLAPGAQLGRLTIWSEAAFKNLDAIYENKKNFTLPRAMLTNKDIDRIYYSDEVQEVLRPKLEIVQIPKGRCCKTLGCCSEWCQALKEVAQLREAHENKKKDPKVVKALFEEVTKATPATPESMAVQILDHEF